ncbi:hypothetical protein Ciccas_003526 [Cichlidogyrus casuarinus]|uniref:G-protein coupled receptors family 1 profile domain-containing protein n=1 Tax=Cichlidogyrus casuarinus TaxID=1844966 RepID=A0ABD2QE40_9PLAT
MPQAREKGASYKGCGPNNDVFVITATLVTFILPLCIMMITYFLTIQSLKRQMREANEAQLYCNTSQQARTRGGSKFWRISRGSSDSGSFRTQKQSSGLEKAQRSPVANGSPPRLLVRADSEKGRMLTTVEEVPTTSLSPSQPRRFQQAVDHIRNLSHCSPTKRRQQHQHKKFELWRIVREYKEMMEQEDQRLELEWASVEGSYEETSQSGRRPTMDEQEARPMKNNSSPTKSHNRLTVSPSKSRHSSIVERFQNYTRNKSPQKNTLDRIHKGKKAMQVIGVLLAVFVTCYLPFFTLYLIGTLCNSCEQWTKPWISRLEWLGYIGSMLNPFVYHFFNPAFRRTFRRILHCDLKRRNEHHRAIWLSKR